MPVKSRWGDRCALLVILWPQVLGVTCVYELVIIYFRAIVTSSWQDQKSVTISLLVLHPFSVNIIRGIGVSQVVQWSRIQLPLQEMLVKAPEEETATHASILAWRVPWTEEPDGLQSKIRRVRYDCVLSTHKHTHHKHHVSVLYTLRAVW